jgi:hypothetical protein
VHPIEHLRYVARAQGADPTSLAVETASALEHLAFDHAGLVVACRRVVERHPTVGPLWWTCAHLLTSTDPARRARELIGELYADPTEDRLVAELSSDATVAIAGTPSTVTDALCRRGDLRVVVVGEDHLSASLRHRLCRADVDHELVPFAEARWHVARSDLVLLEADAVGGGRALVEIGGGVLAAVAQATERPLWVVAGRGRHLPVAYVDAMVVRVQPDGDEAPSVDVLDGSSADLFVTPDGAQAPATALAGVGDCPFAAELVSGVH